MSQIEQTVKLMEDINELIVELFSVRGSSKKLGPLEFAKLLQNQNKKIKNHAHEIDRLRKDRDQALKQISDMKLKSLSEKATRSSKNMKIGLAPALLKRHSEDELMRAQEDSRQLEIQLEKQKEEIRDLKDKIYELRKSKEKLQKHARQKSLALHKVEDDRGSLWTTGSHTKKDEELEVLRREVEVLRLSTKNQAGEVIDRLRKELLSTQKVLVKTQGEKEKLTSDMGAKWKAAYDTRQQQDREWKAERLKFKKTITVLEQENKDLQWDNNKLKDEIKQTDKVYRETVKKQSNLQKAYDKARKENRINKTRIEDLTSQLAKVDKLARGRSKQVDKRLSAKEARLNKINSKKKSQTDKVLKGYQQEIQKLIEKISTASTQLRKVLDDKKENNDAITSLEEVNTFAGNLAWQMNF